MTEQDDLKRDQEILESLEQEETPPALDELAKLEDLEDDDDDLLSESDFSAMATGKSTGGSFADDEIRPVAEPQQPGPSNLPLILLLILVVLIGVGYYFISTRLSGPQGSAPMIAAAPQKQPVPERTAAAEPAAEKTVAPAERVITENVAEQNVAAATEAPAKAEIAEEKVTESAVLTVDEAVSAPAEKSTAQTSEAKPALQKANAAPAQEQKAPVAAKNYSVLVGPFISSADLKNAAAELRSRGYQPTETQGRGLVSMTRLLEGVYPPEAARQRLVAIKEKAGDAFIMPTGENLAIYVGSFSNTTRATKHAEVLAKKGLKVSLVNIDVEMQGKMLTALQTDENNARQISETLRASGFKTQVVRK